MAPTGQAGISYHAESTTARPLVAPPPRTGRRLRIGLLGMFGAGNLGNEGSLAAVLAMLRRDYPDADLLCICWDPARVRAEHGVAATAIRKSQEEADATRGRGNAILPKACGKLREILETNRHLAGLDVLIVPGTGVLDDFGENPRGLPYSLLRWCIGARLRGVKLAFVSVGAGPIRHPVSRWMMGCAARVAHYRSYRDEDSRLFMERLGCRNSRDAVYPDVVFALPKPELRERLRPATGGLTVGLGVMAYYGWYGNPNGSHAPDRSYLRKITQFAGWLLEQGHGIRILVGEASDATASTELETALRQGWPEARNRLRADPCTSLHMLMEQIADTDIVVATRFHNIVCALKMGKPTISLGYARKNEALQNDVGLVDYSQHIETFAVDRLTQQFEQLLRERAHHAAMIRTRVEDYRSQLARQDAALAVWLDR